ncbi:MAG: peptidase MA family metallohydrolase [Anaerolineae bacterium]
MFFPGRANVLARWWLSLFLGVGAALGLARPVQGQAGIEVSEVQVQYQFGEEILFRARIQPSSEIQQVFVLFRQATEDVTRLEVMQAEGGDLFSFRYDARQNVLPPFATIVFWFQMTRADGSTQTSPQYMFRYEDNRFPWQQRQEGGVRVHWYEGDDAFGQAALTAARRGLDAIEQVMPVSLDAPVDIFIYASVEDLQSALVLGGEEWVGGHASPALGVVLVSIAPAASQSIEMETKIPHELAHVMMYRAVGESYNRLPVWLLEGVASTVELYPNPDYDHALRLASQNRSLLAISDLCQAFPPDSGRAFLAYAEVQSFVRYLREMYGATGLMALTKAYVDGLACEIGATRAVGMSLSQLEVRWREAVLGQNVGGVALRNLTPYLFILVVILIVPVWSAVGVLRKRRQKDGGAEQ